MNTMFPDKMRMDRIRMDKIRIKELEDALANSSTVHAVVGAGDLAVEKLRAARGELVNRRATFDANAFRAHAEAVVRNSVGVLQSEAQSAPEKIRALPDKAPELPARAQELLAVLLSGAVSTYGDLTGRGKAVIEQVRGDSVAEDGSEPVSRPKTRKTTKPATKKAAAKKSTPAASSSDDSPSGSADSSSTSDDSSSSAS